MQPEKEGIKNPALGSGCVHKANNGIITQVPDPWQELCERSHLRALVTTTYSLSLPACQCVDGRDGVGGVGERCRQGRWTLGTRLTPHHHRARCRQGEKFMAFGAYSRPSLRPLPAGERRARRATVAGQRGRGLGRAGRWRRAARGLLKNVRAGRMGAGRMRAARDSAVPRPGGGPAAAHPRGGRESAPIRQALAGTGSACPARDRAACVQAIPHGQEKNALAGP